MECPGMIWRCFHYSYPSPKRFTIAYRIEYRLKRRLSCPGCHRCGLMRRLMLSNKLKMENVIYPSTEEHLGYYRSVLLEHRLSPTGRVMDYKIGFEHMEGYGDESNEVEDGE